MATAAASRCSRAKKRRTMPRNDIAIDCISSLPDEILGEIISLLPTKDGVRTQSLASRWRHLWLSAPLNIEHSGIPGGKKSQIDVISRILASHPGPARRFNVRMYLNYRAARVDAWLRSPALNNLQELEFEAIPWRQMQDLPASAFRFSATLRVITIRCCHVLDGVVESLRFPELRQLGLKRVDASVAALHSIIAGSPKLECLLIKLIAKASGGRSIRINSSSLIRIGFACDLYLELIIEDAPSLERLFHLNNMRYSHVCVISAPKLKTVGGLTDKDMTKFTIGGATVIEILRASFTVTVCSVAIDTYKFNLEAVINLMRCFPCLEKLSIQISQSEGKNLWRHKHHDLMRCLDIRLKVLVLKNYQGIKSQAHFATFFIVNAKMLKTMRFEGGPYRDYNKFVAKQHQRLQLGKRASKSAQFHFVECACHKYLAQIEHVTDLSKADPYHCIC